MLACSLMRALSLSLILTGYFTHPITYTYFLLFRIYWIPDSHSVTYCSGSGLHTLSCIHMFTLESRQLPHFSDEETEAWRGYEAYLTWALNSHTSEFLFLPLFFMYVSHLLQGRSMPRETADISCKCLPPSREPCIDLGVVVSRGALMGCRVGTAQ